MATCRNRKTSKHRYIQGGTTDLVTSTDNEDILSKIFNVIFMAICGIIILLMITLMGLSVTNVKKYNNHKSKQKTTTDYNIILIKDSLEYNLLNYTKNPKSEKLNIQSIINLTFTIFTLIGIYIIILFSEFALFAGIELYKRLKPKEDAPKEGAGIAEPKTPGIPSAPAGSSGSSGYSSTTPDSSKSIRQNGIGGDDQTRLEKTLENLDLIFEGGGATKKATHDVVNGMGLFFGGGKVGDVVMGFKPVFKPVYLGLIMLAAILISIVDDATKNIYITNVLPNLNQIKITIQRLRNSIRSNVYTNADFLTAIRDDQTDTIKDKVKEELNKGNNETVAKMAFTYNVYHHYADQFTDNDKTIKDDFNGRFTPDGLRGVTTNSNFEPVEFLVYTDDDIQSLTFKEKFMCEIVNNPLNSDLRSAFGSRYDPILKRVNTYLRNVNNSSTQLSKSELAINIDSLEEYIKTLRIRSIIAGSLMIAAGVASAYFIFPEKTKDILNIIWIVIVWIVKLPIRVFKFITRNDASEQ